MDMTVEQLSAAVLRLPLADRSRLLEKLLHSLQGDEASEGASEAELDAAWHAVAEAREAALRDGHAQAVPLEEALSRLRAAS